MIINNAYNIRDLVFLKTDQDQKERLVTSIEICYGGVFRYCLVCADIESWHYEFEISPDKDFLKM